MERDRGLQLGNEFTLLAFEDAFTAGGIVLKQDMGEFEIVFRGSQNVLLDNAEKFVVKIREDVFKDYYYESWGFPVASRSMQSAIWKIEDNFQKANQFNYFIILKKK